MGRRCFPSIPSKKLHRKQVKSAGQISRISNVRVKRYGLDLAILTVRAVNSRVCQANAV